MNIKVVVVGDEVLRMIYFKHVRGGVSLMKQITTPYLVRGLTSKKIQITEIMRISETFSGTFNDS